MLNIYEDPGFTFWFSECRLIDRFHLPGQREGQRISVHSLNQRTGQPGDVLFWASVGVDGWVQLDESILIQPGQGFWVYPHPDLID